MSEYRTIVLHILPEKEDALSMLLPYLIGYKFLWEPDPEEYDHPIVTIFKISEKYVEILAQELRRQDKSINDNTRIKDE